MAYIPNGTFNFTDTSYTPDASYEFGLVIEDPEGDISVILEGVSSNIKAYIPLEGDISVILEGVSSNILGDIPVSGDISVILEGVSSNITGFINVSGDISVQLEGVSSNIIAVNIQNLGIFQNTILEGCNAGLIGEYDPNVIHWITLENIAVSENTTKQPPEQACFPVEQASYLPVDICSSQDEGDLLHRDLTVVGENGIPIPINLYSVIETGAFLSDLTCFNYEQGTFIDSVLESIREQGTFIDSRTCAVMQQMTKIYPYRWEVPYQDSNRQIDFLHPVMLDPFPPFDNPNGGDYDFTDINYTPDGNYEFNFGRPSNLYVRHIWGVLTNVYNSGLEQATFYDERYCVIVEEGKYPERGKTPWIDIPRPDPDPNPPSGSTYTVPRQEVYTMQNIITVTLEDGITPIQLGDVNLGLDADSSTWSFSASLLDPDEVALIKQLPDGTAIKLHVTINGYVWHVLVEKIVTSRVFGNQSVKISGRGLTALLSKPYEQPISVNVGSDTDIRVIVDNILPLGWNDLGDLYWLLGDAPISSPVSWIVNGGAYSYQNKTPIEAIKELAEDIGVMLVPSPDSQEIYFKSRYPVLPWNFGSVTVDVAIPDDAIIKLTEEPVASFQANGVYIHGNEIGGELAFVRLNGTAGDRLAPTVNNSLMTDVAGLRSLGERLLSGQYTQPKIKSITTFMDGTIVPFIPLGTYVGLTVDSVETRGIVNGVTINVKFGEVSQTITIGESTTNTWVAFKEILPKDPMLVGTLSSTDGVTSLMTLLDGGVVRVRGTGVATTKYYIRSGEIVSEAPNLAQVDIVL